MEPEPKKQRTTATATATSTTTAMKTTVHTTMTTTIFNIPDDCWKLILSYIDNLDNSNIPIHQNNRQSLSTTCKHLLSVTNRLPYSLPFSDQLFSHPDLLHRILRRFSSSLHSIDLTHFEGDGDAALSLLADSSNDLRFLRRASLSSYSKTGLRRLAKVCSGLRVLKIEGSWTLSDDHVIEICNLFCLIEEFDVGIGFQGLISDVGIVYLAEKLQSLSKINVSGHRITDDSLVALSDNCLSLSDVNVRDCRSVTQYGVSYILRHCSKLNHLSVCHHFSSGTWSCFSLQDSFGFSHNLSTLELHAIDVDDSLLISIAKAKLPLRKIMISRCQESVVQGLTAFLGAYPNLEHLELNRIRCLTDEILKGLVHCFKSLTVISLNECGLTEATFCLLVKCCPVLEEICMVGTQLGKGEFSDFLVQNHSIKCLILTDNARLTDEGLQTIGLMCPNLVRLSVDMCCTLTMMGIERVLESCCDIKNLTAFRLSDSKLFDVGLECSGFKIEQLNLACSGIDDDGLSGIAKACPNLMALDITDCPITDTGVKEVVRCCTKLKSIYLGQDLVYYSLNPGIVMWMVKAGPSLKKILAQLDYSPTSSDQEVFFNHGCSVIVYMPSHNTHEEDRD